MTEVTPNDPFAWVRRLEAIDDEIEPTGEDKDLLDTVLPESERDEFESASAGYAFYADDDFATRIAKVEFGGQEEYEAFASKLGGLTLSGQLELFAGLTPVQKAAAFEVANRHLYPRGQ